MSRAGLEPATHWLKASVASLLGSSVFLRVTFVLQEFSLNCLAGSCLIMPTNAIQIAL